MATNASEQEYKGNVINYLNTTGNTAITLSSNGLTLTDDILTTPITVEINQTGIVNGGNTTTWNTLASLDQALASLKIPPNATTLEIENTLLATNGASNSISINASTPSIVITDGTTTNTINQTGYTTKNSVQNLTHYLNFSDSSSTGIGAIQKSASLSCNPSLGTITATTFNGNLNGNASSSSSSTTSTTIDITDTDINSVYYPTFVSSSGTNQTLRADISTTPLSYNPSTSNLTATTFTGSLSGNASTSTTSTNSVNIGVTSDDTNGSYYLPFVKTSGTGDKPLYIDDATTPLTYNPSTSNLTATTFTGDLVGNASSSTTATNATNATNAVNVGITSDNTSGTCYLPFVKTSGTGDKPLYIDDVTTPLTYNPSTSNLSATLFTGNLNGNATSSTFSTTATNAVNVGITLDNSSGTYYLPFVKTSGAGDKPLYIDDTTSPLSYNPSTNVLTATTFMGALSGNASTASSATSATNAVNVGITSDSTNGDYYIPFVKTSGTGDKPLYIDDATTSLTFNPTTAKLSTTSLSSSTNINILNATGSIITPTTGLYIDPIRNVSQSTVLGYDTTSKEITYYPTPGGGGGLSVETVTGTSALSPSVNISLVSGANHSLPLSSTPGFTKMIVNNNSNTFGRITTAVSTTGSTVIIRSLRYDPVLNRMYVGGNYTGINGVSNAMVCTYYDFATSTFVSMGTFTGTDVYDILVSGNRVYITGAFTQISGIPSTQRIAYYDTTTSVWNAMGTGLSSGQGQRLLSYGGFIWVCGSFAQAGGVTGTAKIARWNIGANTWTTVGISGVSTGTQVLEMALVGTNIWICGDFSSAGGAANSQYLAYYDTVAGTFNGYGTAQFTGGSTTALEYIGGNSLIVSGAFTQLGSAFINYTCNFNVSTLTGSQFGVGCLPTVSFYTDVEGVLWNFGAASGFGSQNFGFNSSHYAPTGGIGFWNTLTGNWIPITCNQGVNAMERTGTPGVYWMGGQFNGWDGGGTSTPGFTMTGMGGLVTFNKNNITTINSTLLNNGRTDRNNFNLYYKGQSVDLVNLDNTNWNVTKIQSNPIPYTWLY